MDNTNTQLLDNKEFLPKLLKIMLPIAFQNLMLASVAAADALMLGGLQQNFMSAVSLATQIQFVQNMFVTSIVSVEGILGAQYWGKKDTVSLNKIFNISLKFSFLISLIFFLACMFMPRGLMIIFTNQEDLIEIGAGYLRIAGWSYLLTGISQCYLGMMKVSDHPGKTALISSCTVVVNIVLNAVCIFGLFGVPAMGAAGAAMATLISRIFELVWSVACSYKKDYIYPKLKYFFCRYGLLLWDFIKVLGPLIGAFLFWGVGFTSYNAFMGHLGEDATAANSVAAVVRDLTCCFCNGLCTAAGIVIGNELGAGNLAKGKLYGDTILKIGLIASGIISVIMLILTPIITHCVKLTAGASSLLTGMMLINSVYMYGRSLNTITINGIFDCGGDTMFDMYSLAACMWGLAVPLALLGTFVFHWPVLVVYACTCIDEVGKIPWVLHHYKKYKWVQDLTR
ncbi:MAG: MATE family efflux transporter [Treponema sp.]|nr:MATE family efflux transporter [Treponema sp.]